MKKVIGFLVGTMAMAAVAHGSKEQAPVRLAWNAPAITVTAQRPAPVQLAWNAPTINITAKRPVPVRFAAATATDIAGR